MPDTEKLTVKSPFEVDHLLRARVTEAVIAQSRLRHPGLNDFLRRRLGGRDGTDGELFAQPVLEAATGYVSSRKRPAELTHMLHADLIHALTHCKDGGFRFDYPAYSHQLAAWEKLSPKDRNSVLVSSGTGSGKTECFMVPMLNDLAMESAQKGRLSGVRALMLYPLNALIASQEKRLSQWTEDFGARIRFGLYNGLMLEKRQKDSDIEEAKVPHQVLYRNTLRKDPPPILVTNNTMLEYMTIRREDRGIVEASQGLLRWIIIDEAHSYIGSAAAELALLLRRVMQTFGVEPGQVRIVATSATIGSNSDEDKRTLQAFLADIAGIPMEQAFVITGEPQPIPLKAVDNELAGTSAQELKLKPEKLARHPSVHAAAAAFANGGISLGSLSKMASAMGQSPEEFSEMLAGYAAEERGVIPQRVHGFIRAIPGLWSCLNPACSGDKPEDWPFGTIHFAEKPKCPLCAAPVLEIVSCRECSEPYLLGLDTGDRLTPRNAPPDSDEFASASAREGETSFFEDEEETEITPAAMPMGAARLIALRPLHHTRPIFVNSADGVISATKEGDELYCGSRTPDDGAGESCLCCSAAPNKDGKGPLWPFRFGAPFLMQNVVPTLLSGVSPAEDQSLKLPFDGRRLISFTDSRQGTARLAANIETMGERGFVRSMLYHMVQKAGGAREATAAELNEIKQLQESMAGLPEIARTALQTVIDDKKNSLNGTSVPWDTVVAELADHPMLNHIAQVWDNDRERRYCEDRTALARFLITREIARRPRLANSVETLGFARLIFPAIEKLRDSSLPSEFRGKGKTLQDWKGFLYFLTDWLRGSFAIRIAPEDAHWMPGSSFPRQVLPPGERQQGAKSDLFWPQVNMKGIQPNAVVALVHGLCLDVSDREDREAIASIMLAAWRDLAPLLGGAMSTCALDLSKAEIAATTRAWLCPVTGKVINRTIFGVSQNGLRSGHQAAKTMPQEIHFPNLPAPFPSSADAELKIAEFLEQDKAIVNLRRLGMWNALHDAAARMAPYLRAEEHSAQQPPHRLRVFEKEFEKGKINLLACSTTMEMGVDIGSIEAVLNTNVPPSIANYKQRVGRAGRRDQAFSLSMTLARDSALDREAFADPVQYLKRKVRAPKVSLDSTRIVQRHCNALLLSKWLSVADGQLTKLKAGPFFGCREDFKTDDAQSPCDEFLAWVQLPSSRQNTAAALSRLTQRTALRGHQGIIEECVAQFTVARDAFKLNWGRLADEATLATGAGKSSAEFRARRMLREPLLKELANRSLLPSNGFPSAVIPFLTDNEGRRSKPLRSDVEEQTSRNQRYDSPSRNADIAIREYAPGAEVVIDGLVWKSAGVTLNWQRHAAEEETPQIQSLRFSWLCKTCGEAGTAIVDQSHCSGCGSADLDKDRFLEPAGFRVERNAQPHADTDNASFIEPIPARISAKGSAWQPLLDATFGRARATTDGLVFHMSKGRQKAGYRLCLDCGRMEEDADGALHAHKPLGYVKDKGDFCPGNEKTYAITPAIALGHEVHTDVVEVQFEGLVHEGASWAVASALRESLARQLGIEPRELGLGVNARAGRLNGPTHSLFLFDSACGGAGYAPRLLDLWAEVLPEAAAILNCPMKCERGCSACVLASDLYAHQDSIDRPLAAAWFIEFLARAVTLDPLDKVADDAKLSPPVGDALVSQLRAGDTIYILAQESFAVEALHQPPLSDLFAMTHLRGATAHFVLAKPMFDALALLDKIALRNAALRHSFFLSIAAESNSLGKSKLIAIHGQEAKITGYYSRDHGAAIPSDHWGIGLDHPVVSLDIKTMPAIDLVAADALELQASNTGAVVPMEQFPSVSLAKFGQTFIRDWLQPQLQAIGRWQVNGLTSLEYSDRYLRSPLAVHLALSTLSALRQSLADTAHIAKLPCKISTLALRSNDWVRAPYRIWDDWSYEDDREDVAYGLCDAMGLNLQWDVGHAPHRRELVLKYIDGSSCRIYLDQGFGYWQADRAAKFDFRATVKDQIAAMRREGVSVSGNGQSFLALKAE